MVILMILLERFNNKGAIKFDLNKPKEKLQFVLQKHNVNSIIPCQVHLAFDVSLSF